VCFELILPRTTFNFALLNMIFWSSFPCIFTLPPQYYFSPFSPPWVGPLSPHPSQCIVFSSLGDPPRSRGVSCLLFFSSLISNGNKVSIPYLLPTLCFASSASFPQFFHHKPGQGVYVLAMPFSRSFPSLAYVLTLGRGLCWRFFLSLLLSLFPCFCRNGRDRYSYLESCRCNNTAP